MDDTTGRLVVAAVALATCAGCTTSEHTVRLLDRVCLTNQDIYGTEPAADQCSVVGDAVETTGVTGNSVGFHIGPAGGEVHISLSRVAAATEYAWSLDVLAASAQPEGSQIFRTLTWGSCGADCPSDPPDVEATLPNDDFAWVQVGEGLFGANYDGVPGDAKVIFRGSNLDILDIRTPGSSSDVYY